MNAFYDHHKDSIRLHYRCFDRILLNGLIQPFQQPKRVVGFFDTYRRLYPVSRQTLTGIADRFQQWLKAWSEKRNVPILEAPKGRRDEFVEPYFKGAKPDEVVAIVKAREPARIMIAIGDKAANRWHLQFAQRWVVQYNFYVNDREWGRMFVRICPYLPFSARVCLNQHHWLANRMREEGIDFQQCSNAFFKCAKPDRLQELADQLAPRDLVTCGQKWLAYFTPFFTAAERENAGCQHRLFFAQVEFCDNLVFHRRAALDKLAERLLDANRTIGQPNKITTIFGRKVTKRHQGKLQTVIEDMHLPNPVIRSHYRNGFIKQYVRDHLILRTEPASNNVTDYGVKKHRQRQAHPWPQARQPAPTRPHARSRAVHARRRCQRIHHRRTPPRGRRRARRKWRSIHPRLSALRPLKTSCQRLGREAAAFPSLPAPPQRIFDLPRLPEALRAHLCSADCRPALARQGGRQARRPAPIATRPPLSARCRRSR